MKDFFRNMNFPRAVILLSLIASAVLGWFVYEKTNRLTAVQKELRAVPELARSIQQLGIELEQLQGDDSGAGVGQEDQFDPYIRETAASAVVGIGQVKIDPSKRDYNATVVDNIYKIRLANKNQRYHRSKIGNFLYKLEAENRRVRVTSLKLTPYPAIKPGELGTDTWIFEAEITSRQKKSS